MKKTVTFGELLLRLKSPGNERLFQTSMLEATFGGSEANVAVSLAQFGHDVSFVTSLPNTSIGRAAVTALKSHSVNVSDCITCDGRLGIYFLETGACQRPSVVIYDRENSCIARAVPADFDWPSILAGAGWLHISGITAALSQSAADCALSALRAAQKMGITTSLDLNYRKKLWKYGKSAIDVMPELVSVADVVIGNEEDIQLSLGILPDMTVGKSPNAPAYEKLAECVKEQYSNVSLVAITMRGSLTADKNEWQAVLLGKTGMYVSRSYTIDDIVDRVGSGDAFAAGLIHCLQSEPQDEQGALEFATAASCLKHSIPGDFNLITENEVRTLMNGAGNGRVQR